MSKLSRATIVRRALGSLLLLGGLASVGFALSTYKGYLLGMAAAQAAAQPEPAEAVEVAVVGQRLHTPTTTAIGTVRALRSITLRNELPGTVRRVAIETGRVVEPGELLVELDVAVELAELTALEAEQRLAESMLGRMERALQNQGASAADVDRARAERDKAAANVARLRAVIDQKRIQAPFRARAGLVDLNVGQYLEPGSMITTLQGVDASVHVDFAVPQEVAARLRSGSEVRVVPRIGAEPIAARVVAIEALVDARTRNATIRAELVAPEPPQPGASVRVEVPIGAPQQVLVVPVNALRRGPSGDHVFVLVEDAEGRQRAFARRVESGSVLGDEVIVRSGLEAGTRIAAAGSFKLHDGSLVHAAAANGRAQ